MSCVGDVIVICGRRSAVSCAQLRHSRDRDYRIHPSGRSRRALPKTNKAEHLPSFPRVSHLGFWKLSIGLKFRSPDAAPAALRPAGRPPSKPTGQGNDAQQSDLCVVAEFNQSPPAFTRRTSSASPTRNVHSQTHLPGTPGPPNPPAESVGQGNVMMSLPSFFLLLSIQRMRGSFTVALSTPLPVTDRYLPSQTPRSILDTRLLFLQGEFLSTGIHTTTLGVLSFRTNGERRPSRKHFKTFSAC